MNKLIKPGDSRLLQTVALEGLYTGKGPFYHLFDLRDSFLVTKLGFSEENLIPSYMVDIYPLSHRGGRVGHYHKEKKEVFCSPGNRLILFTADQEGNKEIVDLDARVPKDIKNMDEFYFPVVHIPIGISHLIYNPNDNLVQLLVLSQMSAREANERDTFELKAFDGDLEEILKELKI